MFSKMYCATFSYLKLVILFIYCTNLANSQYYNPNDTVPYPYQTALGLYPGQGLGMQNVGIQPAGRSVPDSFSGNLTPTTNTTQALDNYYALLAQQGRPAYQFPVGYPQPGVGYPQLGIGYPQAGIGYPQPGIGYPQPAFGYQGLGVGGYGPQGFGYSQPYQPSGGFGYGYPGMRYPYQGLYQGAVPPQGGQGIGQQQYGLNSEMYPNIKTETIDVSPEFHRKYLGLPSDSTPDENGRSIPVDAGTGSIHQGTQNIQPRYEIKVDSQTSNYTNIPSNLTKPIVTSKKFTTSIRRTFVYDSSKPGEPKAINLHFVNGEPVTTTPPPTTTENEEVAVPAITPKGRRFMDVPESCPKGTLLGHNGKCIAPFSFAGLGIAKNASVENTTQAPEEDENEILTRNDTSQIILQ